MLSNVFCPAVGDHSIATAKRVMHDTNRLLAEGARCRQSIHAKASAKTPTPDAAEVFFDSVAKAMDAGHLSKAAAIQQVAAQQPELHRAWVRASQRERSDRLAAEQREASRARARRNSR